MLHLTKQCDLLSYGAKMINNNLHVTCNQIPTVPAVYTKGHEQ